MSERNDAPIAADDTATVDEGGSIDITASTLLANDSDAEDDALTITAVGSAVNGTVTLPEDKANGHIYYGAHSYAVAHPNGTTHAIANGHIYHGAYSYAAPHCYRDGWAHATALADGRTGGHGPAPDRRGRRSSLGLGCHRADRPRLHRGGGVPQVAMAIVRAVAGVRHRR